MDYPAVILRNCQTTELSYSHTVILWNCRTIELSYYQTVIPKGAPITAMADFPFVIHWWLHFNMRSEGLTVRYSYCLILRHFCSILRNIELKQAYVIELFQLKSMFSKVSSVKLKDNSSNLMNIIFLLHKRPYAYRAVGLFSCRTNELSVDLMVHKSEEIR